jgi:hypothetical protein
MILPGTGQLERRDSWLYFISLQYHWPLANQLAGVNLAASEQDEYKAHIPERTQLVQIPRLYIPKITHKGGLEEKIPCICATKYDAQRDTSGERQL